MLPLTTLARQRYGENNLAEAERLCGLALKGQSRDGAALHLLGLIRFQQERLDEAGFFLAAAIGAAPGSAAALNDLGTVLQAQGRTEEAIEHHRRALEA